MCRTLGSGAVTVVSIEGGFKVFLKIYNTYYCPDVDLNLILVS